MYHYILLDGLTNPTVVSKSKVTVKFKNPNEPVRPRVVPFSGSNVLLRNKEHETTTTTTKVKTSSTFQTKKATKKSSDSTLLFELLWNSYNSKKPVLKWGVLSESYSHTNYANTDTISADQMCGPPATTTGFRDYGLIHTSVFDFTQLRLEDATEKTKIYYIFGDEATSDYSKEHVFYIPPLAGQIKQNNDPTTVGSYIFIDRYNSFI